MLTKVKLEWNNVKILREKGQFEVYVMLQVYIRAGWFVTDFRKSSLRDDATTLCVKYYCQELDS